MHGDPADVLLWVWDRVGDDRVTITGDAGVVAYLRQVFAAGAQ